MARSTRRERPGPESEGGRVVLLTVLGLVLLAGAGYVGAYLAASDKIPVGTRVAGVDIGGHRPTTAVDVLRNGLADRARTPFTVTVNGHVQQVRPGQVGIGVDYAASVAASGAVRGWRPSQLWSYYTAGGDVAPVKTLNQPRLARLIAWLDANDGRRPVNGSVVFGQDSFRIRQPRPGLVLDPQSTGSAFWSAYLSGDPSVSLQMRSVSPAIDAAAVQRFVRQFANPAVQAAVRLRLGGESVRLQPSAYAHLLGARTAGRRLVPTVRAAALKRVVDARLGGGRPVDRPHNATIAIVGGQPRLVKARPGLVYEPAAVGHALLRAIVSPSRTARVRASLKPARFGNADAQALGITDQVSWATIALPRGSHESRVLAAALKLDGTVLRPGHTLSLRARLGGGMPGGAGADRLATVLFDAAWKAGLRIGAHATQPSYTGDYPVGRDATVSNGQDLAFLDSTRYGVLVSVVAGRPSRQHGGSITVELWSTPVWKVTSRTGNRTHVVPAGRVVGHGAGCHPRAGLPGFDVTVTRRLTPARGPGHARTGSYTVHYAPRPALVCRAH